MISQDPVTHKMSSRVAQRFAQSGQISLIEGLALPNGYYATNRVPPVFEVQTGSHSKTINSFFNVLKL